MKNKYEEIIINTRENHYHRSGSIHNSRKHILYLQVRKQTRILRSLIYPIIPIIYDIEEVQEYAYILCSVTGNCFL